MADETKTWWAVSIDDGETWDGQFERAEAIKHGTATARQDDAGHFLIAPAVSVTLEGYGPSAQQVLEDTEDALAEEFEDAEIRVGEDATEALGIMLDKVWEAWVAIYKPHVTAFAADMDKIERIEVTP